MTEEHTTTSREELSTHTALIMALGILGGQLIVGAKVVEHAFPMLPGVVPKTITILGFTMVAVTLPVLLHSQVWGETNAA